MGPFLQRLKKRKLVQWALAYLAGAFVVFQLLDALETPLGLTASLQQVILLFIGIGFLLTLVLAWYHGEKGRQRVSGPELLIIAALLVISGVALTTLRGSGRSTRSSIRPDIDDLPGVAVLPCASLSADSGDEYLADALHDEILLQLQKISSLFSIGRTSVLRYADNPPATEIVAAELRVGFVGECTVQKQGDRIRLIFQLLDGKSGGQVWADAYEGELTAENLWAIHGDIARQIARRVSAVVTPEEQARIGAIPTENISAYQAYLHGRLEWAKRTEEGLRAAIDHYTTAIEADPDFARAYAGLADAYVVVPYYGAFLPAREAWERATAAAERAVEIDDGLSETHVALGGIKMYYEWDWEGAESEYMRAIEIDPNNPFAHHWYGFLLYLIGRADEAVEKMEMALHFEPFSVVIRRNLGQALTRAGRYDAAIDHYRSMKEDHPNWSGLERSLAEVYRAMGDHEAALELSPGGSGGIASLVALERHDAALALADQTDRSWLRTRVNVAAALNDADAAISLLIQAYDERQPWLTDLAHGSLYGSIRSDSRVQDLIRRMGFPE